MSVDLDKLAELARAATPGPWEAPHQPESVVNVWTTAPEAAIRASDIAAHGEATGAAVFHELGNGIAQDIRGPDAAFIAAANPAAVLELIERVRAAEGKLAEVRDWAEMHARERHRSECSCVGAMSAFAGPGGGLPHTETLRAIVRDLAGSKTVVDADGIYCVLCDAGADYAGDRLVIHAESCPWRRAVEATKP